MKREIRLHGETHPVALARSNGRRATIRIGENEHEASLRAVGAGEHRLVLDGRSHRLWMVARGDTVYLHAFGRSWELTLVDPLERAAGHGGGGADTATAPMPGTVVSVCVSPGEAVRKGQPLIVMESMKLETAITAWRHGTVEAVPVTVGATVERGSPLVSLAAEET